MRITHYRFLAGDKACFERHISKAERAWFARYMEPGESEALRLSEAQPRWGWASVAARNMPWQDPLKSKSEQARQGHFKVEYGTLY